ncbi:MAG: hypothetical protein AAF404_00485 [Pseudomonadota bacterium]
MSTHPDLDLQNTIRPGLDILANEIVIGLKKRTRFKVNAAVYRPGLVASNADCSLLDYELNKVEQCHAELGRYDFATQEAFTRVDNIDNVIKRATPHSPVHKMDSGVGPRLINFYVDWVNRACPPGDDSNTYGETVTADVSALLAIMERVNLGKTVAESKLTELPDEFIATGGDREAMLKLIVRKDREAKVIELAHALASHYDLEAAHAEAVFRFMIDVTVDIEVDYLRMRLKQIT